MLPYIKEIQSHIIIVELINSKVLILNYKRERLKIPQDWVLTIIFYSLLILQQTPLCLLKAIFNEEDLRHRFISFHNHNAQTTSSLTTQFTRFTKIIIAWYLIIFTRKFTCWPKLQTSFPLQQNHHFIRKETMREQKSELAVNYSYQTRIKNRHRAHDTLRAQVHRFSFLILAEPSLGNRFYTPCSSDI